MARQDRDTLKALITSTITTNNNKEISGADVNTVATNLADSAIFYNEAQSKENVRVATTAAGTLATSFENGDTIDGVVLATGDRILIKDQASASENGCYTINSSGAPTRSTDFDSADEVILGSIFYVEEGTTNAGTYYYLSAPTGTITLGSSSLTFTILGTAFNISGLSAFSGSIDTTNDYVPMYDNSAAGNLKVPMSRVVPYYGTFTPAIAFGGSSTGVTYSAQTGKYIETILADGKYKIEFNIYIEMTNNGSGTGDMTITGLPRTANDDYMCLFSYKTTGAGGASGMTADLFGITNSGASTITIYKAAADLPVQDTNFEAASTNTACYLNGWYLNG